jgi:spore maturation protein CgeB
VEMLKALRMAKIGFNIHIDKAIKDAGNMRIFEVTGVGACLVTDWKENIGELFEPGKEIITFQSVEECVENIKWLIDHPVYREEIAKAGQARCLRDHTYAKRAIELNHIICSML